MAIGTKNSSKTRTPPTTEAFPLRFQEKEELNQAIIHNKNFKYFFKSLF